MLKIEIKYFISYLVQRKNSLYFYEERKKNNKISVKNYRYCDILVLRGRLVVTIEYNPILFGFVVANRVGFKNLQYEWWSLWWR